MGSHLRLLSESYVMITDMTGFRWFSKFFASLNFVTRIYGIIMQKPVI